MISRWILIWMRNISDKICTAYQNTIQYSITFFQKSCCLWDNVKKYGTVAEATNYNIIRRIRFASWVTNATDTPRMCNKYCFSMATMVTRTPLNVTLCLLRLFCISICTLCLERDFTMVWCSDYHFRGNVNNENVSYNILFLNKRAVTVFNSNPCLVYIYPQLGDNVQEQLQSLCKLYNHRHDSELYLLL
jgi:hypothetical protein